MLTRNVVVLSTVLSLTGCALLGGGYKPINTKATVQTGEGYQPLDPGRSWMYQGKATIIPLALAMRMSGATVDATGKPLALMAVRSKTVAGTTDSTVYLHEDDEGVRVMRTDSALDITKGLGVEGGEVGILYAPSKTEVKKTMSAGDTWTEKYKVYADINMRVKTGFSIDDVLEATGLNEIEAKEEKEITETKTVHPVESVTVPFGTFEAIKVESHPNEAQTIYSWYADGYGMVKQSTVQDGSEVAYLELVDMNSTAIDAYFGDYDFMKKYEWVVDAVKKFQ